jgi:hypothetical protein
LFKPQRHKEHKEQKKIFVSLCLCVFVVFHFPTTSKQLSEKEKEARLLLSNAISYLESEYGKTSTELERYGIAKRQFTGRKALKKDPVKA